MTRRCDNCIHGFPSGKPGHRVCGSPPVRFLGAEPRAIVADDFVCWKWVRHPGIPENQPMANRMISDETIMEVQHPALGDHPSRDQVADHILAQLRPVLARLVREKGWNDAVRGSQEIVVRVSVWGR